jgi:hypothetical protein
MRGGIEMHRNDLGHLPTREPRVTKGADAVTHTAIPDSRPSELENAGE